MWNYDEQWVNSRMGPLFKSRYDAVKRVVGDDAGYCTWPSRVLTRIYRDSQDPEAALSIVDGELCAALGVPSSFPQAPALSVLSRVRGSMWTQRLNLPLGPRPNQDSNINAMDYYQQYGPDDRKRMIDKTLSGGFTHAVTGPFYDEGGYHGKWAPQTSLDQKVWDTYLDCMEEWKAAGILPIHFISPDNWTLDQCKTKLSALYLQPRAQALLPIKVPHGWEPDKYGTSSRTWALWGDWGAEISAPNTLILAHTVADLDALVGTDSLYDDNTDGQTNGQHWQYVAPHFHGWLIQLGGYVDAAGDPTKIEAYRTNLAGYFQDMKARFQGRGDWPKGSRFGPNVPLKKYLGEDASYIFFNNADVSESEVQAFGDIAMANGADGYLDGGTVNVP